MERDFIDDPCIPLSPSPINAGLIAEGKADKHAMSDMLVDLILDVASGKKQSKAQQHRIYNDLVIDNPAPIT